MAESSDVEAPQNRSVKSWQSKEDRNLSKENHGHSWHNIATHETWKCAAVLAPLSKMMVVQGLLRAYIVAFALYTESIKIKPDWPEKRESTVKKFLPYVVGMSLPWFFFSVPAIAAMVKTLSLRTWIKDFRGTVSASQMDQQAVTVFSAKCANVCQKLRNIGEFKSCDMLSVRLSVKSCDMLLLLSRTKPCSLLTIISGDPCYWPQ
ncbi:uncharacterized protein LOC129589708 [Paramacrobiotus metropolitanus]|uniref:uncharacterized protein LOC129589708 n=1 Tax=Paramacrobiotus metropolitanus TaxID=2943436 RepID=UPI002445B978|nr:uncharacterized protein LOC129589708 [Paramacrobiotus metropolitanus]